MKLPAYRVRLGIVLASSFTLALTSCATTTRVAVSEGLQDVRISPAKGALAVSLKTPTLEPSKKGTIDETRSFAVFQNGMRYGIIVDPDEYANSYPEQSYFISNYIWLETAKGGKRNWQHGEWKLVLVLQSSRGAATYRVKFKMSSQSFSILNTNGEF